MFPIAYLYPAPLLFGIPNPMEMFFLLVIVLVLFGPGKLPAVCRAVGDGIKQLKNASRDVIEEPPAQSSTPSSSETPTNKPE